MNKKSLLTLLIGASLLVSRTTAAETGGDPLYRLYHPGLQAHLYTEDKNEYTVLAKRGWRQEGVAYNTHHSKGNSVYRLYHPGLKVHLYTKDKNEYTVLAKRGWKQEGEAYKSYGSMPIYRLYHPGIKKHLYTKDKNEYTVLAKRGWKQEGTAFYALSGQDQVTPLEKAQAALNQAKADVKQAQAKVQEATQALAAVKYANSKQGQADRAAAIQKAQEDVNARTDAVNTAKARVTAAQTEVTNTTATLASKNAAVKNAQDALKNVDTIDVKLDSNFKDDLKNWQADASQDNMDFLKDSGFNSITTSTITVGADDKAKTVNIDNVTDEQAIAISHVYATALNQLRQQLGTASSIATVTDTAIAIAQSRAKQYEVRGTDPLVAGHIPGAIENLVSLGSASNINSLYDLKSTTFQAFETTSFDDSRSKWEHLRANMYANGGVGVSIANINGTYWMVIVLGQTGTIIPNTEKPTLLQANLDKAKAEQVAAQTASDNAKAKLTQASADYATALDVKTQAEKILNDAMATPLQTQVAENNLRLAKIALQNAQERQADAQAAVDKLKLKK